MPPYKAGSPGEQHLFTFKVREYVSGTRHYIGSKTTALQLQQSQKVLSLMGIINAPR
jgi:hypothetical protein